MKTTRIEIRLYIIVPLIFAGLTLLASMIIYHTTQYYIARSLDPVWPLAFWTVLMVVFSLLAGLAITHMLVKPIKDFIVKTEKLGVVHLNDRPQHGRRQDEISLFVNAVDQVTELLSKLEARKLFPGILGQSKGILGVLSLITKVAPSDSSVLVQGESGTGKELVAKSLHEHSPRHDKPFIAVNCAAIPAALLESELFGHEKGAFTGANARKTGKFEAVDNGTIFLDEIADMPLETQAKILRVLEEKEITRVGGNHLVKVDVRFIAATNKDLSKMVAEGTFREDLFFRINAVSIYLPPLRDRLEDIPLLVAEFLKQESRVVDISADAMGLLISYSWPGNIRELKNVVATAGLLAEERITPAHLPSAITGIAEKTVVSKVDKNGNISLDDRMMEIEKGIIIDALVRAGGVQTKAAKLLDIKDRSLWHRISKYGIDVDAIKHGPKLFDA